MTAVAAGLHRTTGRIALKIAAGYGRLYVSGPLAPKLRALPGATMHQKTRSMQLSLTLESLRAVRKTLGLTKSQMAACCTDDVLRWSRAAGAQEQQVLAVHARLRDGWRGEFPWRDTRADTVLDRTPTADEIEKRHVYQDTDGRWVWRYRVPFEHQKVMTAVAASLDGAAFLCEQGTGKTRPACEVAAHWLATGQCEAVLILPPKGVMKTWNTEVGWWTTHTAQMLRGTLAERKAALAEQPTGIVVLSHTALHECLETIVAWCKRRRVAILVDEMQAFKNPQAQRTQALMEIVRWATRRLGQTGTPITNGAHEIWSQWYLVDLGVTFGANYVQFRREFFDENAWSWNVDPKDGTLDEIGTRIQLRGVRYRKEDCLDLPPKVYEADMVEMTPAQHAAYRQMEEELIVWLRQQHERAAAGEEVATAANKLVMMLRLTQITSGFLPTDGGGMHMFAPNKKLLRTIEIVREQVRMGRSVIVWATYTNDVAALMGALADLRPSRVDGTQQGPRGDRERDEAERRFQARETQVLIGNPAAGGRGLNLQAASVAVYYSQRYSLEQRLQSEDRCHRSGSESHNKVTYIDMVCEGTIDETIREALAQKKSVADAVVDMERRLGV